jgi:hypothetical protein
MGKLVGILTKTTETLSGLSNVELDDSGVACVFVGTVDIFVGAVDLLYVREKGKKIIVQGFFREYMCNFQCRVVAKISTGKSSVT